MCKANLGFIYQALLRSLDDYTMDRRGDIGAWVREAAITALQVCLTTELDLVFDFPVQRGPVSVLYFLFIYLFFFPPHMVKDNILSRTSYLVRQPLI